MPKLLPLPPLDTPGLSLHETRTLRSAMAYPSLSHKQIAEQLGINYATFNTQINNARRKHKDHLNEIAMREMLKGCPDVKRYRKYA